MASHIFDNAVQGCFQSLRGLDLDIGEEMRIVLRQTSLYQVLISLMLVELDVLDRSSQRSRQLGSNL